MSSAVETVDVEEDESPMFKPVQQAALEMMVIGASDTEIARVLKVRRETLWRWKNRDQTFQGALQVRRAELTESAAERIQGMLDRAATVVQESLYGRNADPRVAMSMLMATGVLDRARELGLASGTPGNRAEGRVVEGEDDLERKLDAIEVETGAFVGSPAELQGEAGMTQPEADETHLEPGVKRSPKGQRSPRS